MACLAGFRPRFAQKSKITLTSGINILFILSHQRKRLALTQQIIPRPNSPPTSISRATYCAYRAARPTMDGNKEEAQRCLSIAQRHRSSSNLPSALKFARKSVTLFSTPQGEAMITIIEREIETGGSASGSNMPNGTGATAGRASGVEEHVTSAHSRPGRAAGGGGGEKPKKREYTVQQMEVVKRVKGCKHHEYYEILSCEYSRDLVD